MHQVTSIPTGDEYESLQAVGTLQSKPIKNK